uniref:Photosystem I assembly protein Ycf37 n=1 Tax=Liagora harveyana TaxID=406718 RepID=A0A1G4NV00_9FLOR|nr:Hypothetical protein ycf37 [Liagora harveyana]SCW22502.1 Hypothetical protein ycf37 [Liagora harveyana]
MPIIYLTFLSFILSPLTYILLMQNINFYKYENAFSIISVEKRDNLNQSHLHYQISQIYMRQHQWFKAITILDNLSLDQSSNRYYKEIALILNKNKQDTLANKYCVPSLTQTQNKQ